jgi:putative proteasome-type protease
MHTFGNPGERQFVILSAGNLATTQGVISHLKRDINKFAPLNLMTVSHMAEAADYLGEVSKIQQEKHTGGGINFEASFIIGGEILGSGPSIYMIYPQGNHITTSDNTLYLQIGESKYGKPILDRILDHNVSLETASLCALVSMDSTMRSNITVGPPIELTIYQSGSMIPGMHYRYEEDSEFLRELKRSWDRNLKEAFNRLPQVAWSTNWDNKNKEQTGV